MEFACLNCRIYLVSGPLTFSSYSWTAKDQPMKTEKQAAQPVKLEATRLTGDWNWKLRVRGLTVAKRAAVGIIVYKTCSGSWWYVVVAEDVACGCKEQWLIGDSGLKRWVQVNLINESTLMRSQGLYLYSSWKSFYFWYQLQTANFLVVDDSRIV